MKTYEYNDFVKLPFNEIMEVFSLPITSLELDSWDWYEENIEFDSLVLNFNNGQVIIENVEGYNCLWEMLSFDKLSEQYKLQTSKDIAGWLLYRIVKEIYTEDDNGNEVTRVDEFEELYPEIYKVLDEWRPSTY